MKKLIFLAVAAIAFSLSTQAQTTKTPEPTQKVQRDHNKSNKTAHLDLTAKQKEQMKALHEKSKTERDAIKNDNSLTPDQKKDRMKELHKTQKDHVKTILTKEQQEKMKANRKAHKGHKKHHGEKGKTSSQKPVKTDPKVK